MSSYEIDEISAFSENRKKKGKGLKGKKLDTIFNQTSKEPSAEFVNKGASSNKVSGKLFKKCKPNLGKSDSNFIIGCERALNKAKNKCSPILEIKGKNKRKLQDSETTKFTPNKNLKKQKYVHPSLERITADSEMHQTMSKFDHEKTNEYGTLKTEEKMKSKGMKKTQLNRENGDCRRSQILQVVSPRNRKRSENKNNVEEKPFETMGGNTGGKAKKTKHSLKIQSNNKIDSRNCTDSQICHVGPSQKNKNKSTSKKKRELCQVLADGANENMHVAKICSNAEDINSRNNSVSKILQKSPSCKKKKNRKICQTEKTPSCERVGDTNLEVNKNKCNAKTQLNIDNMDSTSNASNPDHKMNSSCKSKKNKNNSWVAEEPFQDLLENAESGVNKIKASAKKRSDVQGVDSRSVKNSQMCQVDNPSSKSNKKKNQINGQHLQESANGINNEVKKHMNSFGMGSNMYSRKNEIVQIFHASPLHKEENKIQTEGKRSRKSADHKVKKNKLNTKTSSNVRDADSGSTSVSQVPQVGASNKSKKVKLNNLGQELQQEFVSDANDIIKKNENWADILPNNVDRSVSRQSPGGSKKTKSKLVKTSHDLTNDSKYEAVTALHRNLEKHKVSNLFSAKSLGTSVANLEKKQLNESIDSSDEIQTNDSKIANNEVYENDKGYISLSKTKFHGFEGCEGNIERQKRTVFVGNLPTSCSKKELQLLFQPFGNIQSSRIRSAIPVKETISKRIANITMKYHETCYSLNGFVVFQRAVDAANSLSLNGTIIRNHHIRVDLAINCNNHDTQCSVFIGNLPFGINEDVIWSAFSECGAIKAVRLVRDSNNGVCKGFGFVRFEDKDSVQSALKLNETEVWGRNIRVKVVEKEKSEKHSKLEKKPWIGSKLAKERKQMNGDQINPLAKRKSKKKLIKKSKELRMKKKIASILKN